MHYTRFKIMLFSVVYLLTAVCAFGEIVDDMPESLKARGGVGVIIGGDGDVAAPLSLSEAGPWVLHLLNKDEETVHKMRESLQREGRYGRITAEKWSADRLPYADNLVNFIYVHQDEPGIEGDELLRVLAPEGMAWIAGDDDVTQLDKPRPEAMGDWTHPWHDAHGSLAGDDRLLDMPNVFQWIAGPTFPPSSRKDNTGVLLSAGNRVFAITENVSQNLPSGSRNYLVARDAFNGVLLWSRRWGGSLERWTQGWAARSHCRNTDAGVWSATWG